MSFWSRERRTRAGVVVLVLSVFGSALLLQPDRWARTPSYGLLLNLADQQWWAFGYLSVAALMAGYIVWPMCRKLAVIAHTAAVALLLFWLAAFVVRWITDDATTIVNVVSWSTFLYLAVRSALMIDVNPLEKVGDSAAGPR